jgi:hypothetical protein
MSFGGIGVPQMLPEENPKADKLTDIERQEMWDIIGRKAASRGFRSVPQLTKVMDADGGGSLNRLELRQFLGEYFKFPPEKADRFFSLMDESGDGIVEVDEFSHQIAPYLARGMDATEAYDLGVDVEEQQNHHLPAAQVGYNVEVLPSASSAAASNFNNKGYRQQDRPIGRKA